MPRHLLTAGLVALAASVLCGQQYVDVTAAAGLQRPAQSLLFLGEGLCTGDFDRDGDLDLVVAEAPGQQLRYFRNDGAMSFSDQTAASGFATFGIVRGLTPADVDGDGDLDLYVCHFFAPNALYMNDGTGSFTDEAPARGVDVASGTWGATFGDFDRDGRLDMYLAVRSTLINTQTPNLLFRNTGGGYFTDVTTASGTGHLGLTLVASFIDYDRDGWPDIFLANDKGTSLPPNTMFRNNGDGTFNDVGVAINCAQGLCGMGLDYIDAFNDGGVDLFVTDAQPDHLFLEWNPATGMYTAVQNLFLTPVPSIGWSAHFFDHDNDMWPDLHIVHWMGINHLQHNPAQPFGLGIGWPQISASIGLDSPYAQYSELAADFDNDGDIDVLNRTYIQNLLSPPGLLQLMRNDVATANWLKLRLVGTASNRDGLGAVVRITAGGVTQEQEMRSGIGYLTSGPLVLHFGLATQAQTDRVEIRWPSGQIQVLGSVAANQFLTVTEPSLGASGTTAVGTTLSLELAVQGDAGLGYLMALAAASAPGIPVAGGRTVPLSVDPLSLLTSAIGNPILPLPAGTLSAGGSATSPLTIPNLPYLVGANIHSAAVTFDPTWPGGIKTIVDGQVIVIQ